MLKFIKILLLTGLLGYPAYATHIEIDKIKYKNDWFQNTHETYVITEKPHSSTPISNEISKDFIQQGRAVIYFSFGSSTLNKTSQQKLNSLKTTNFLIESVTGYTCQIGDTRTNEKLALNRASAVAQKLRQNGFKIKNIQGKGNCCFLSETRLDRNRRVEIIFQEVVKPSGL